MDQKSTQKKMEKNQRLAKTREKKKRSPNLRLINHHKTHTSLTLYIYLKHHGHHVREIVPAPLFEEGNAHFDGASRKRSGFSVVLAVSFFLSFIFSPPREFSLLWARKSSEGEERFLNRDDFYARVVFLLNVPRLDAKRARGRMRRVYVRAI